MKPLDYDEARKAVTELEQGPKIQLLRRVSNWRKYVLWQWRFFGVPPGETARLIIQEVAIYASGGMKYGIFENAVLIKGVKDGIFTIYLEPEPWFYTTPYEERAPAYNKFRIWQHSSDYDDEL